MAAESDENNVFDEIMVQVGDSGKFQKVYNIVFNYFFVCMATMATFNSIISIAIPDHWCKVPGRESTNYTIEEWKNLTIPLKTSTPIKYNHCMMYNRTHWTDDNHDLVGCMYGWEYNTTYYHETIVTQENWVCDREMYGTNFLVFGKIGEIIGTMLAQLGDVYGRRPVFYASIVVILIGRLGLILSKGIYFLFITFSIIGSLPNLSMFQTPLVISVEVSSVEDRTFIPLFQCIAWTSGLCIAPMIYWIMGDWIPFTIVTTLPVIVFVFFPNYMIESPRWLASKGKTKQCIGQLKKIAKVNKKEIPDKLLNALKHQVITPEKNFGAMSLFSSWNLAKKSILIILGWICYMMIYIIVFLNVSNLEGNPFLNYLWQGLAELPGYFLGKYMCDTIGRKYTKLIGFIGMAVASIILAYFLSLSGYVIAISVCGIVLKFLSSIEFYAINLQTLEIYPTCLRQTGSSMGFVLASIFGIFTPYIIYLGTSVNATYPYIFSTILAVLGGISGIFLPETLNEKLPETVAEAEQFGADQKLWSLPKGKSFTHKPVATNDVI